MSVSFASPGVVDEPTVGLDPEESVRFRNLLSEIAHGRLLILSTHIVSDVEAVALERGARDRASGEPVPGLLQRLRDPPADLDGLVDGKRARCSS